MGRKNGKVVAEAPDGAKSARRTLPPSLAAKAKPFRVGEARTREMSARGNAAKRAKAARFRSLREAAEALRDLPSASGGSLSNGVAAVLAMYRAAQDGDSRAFSALANLLGESEVRVDGKNLPILRDDVPRFDAPQEIPGTGRP